MMDEELIDDLTYELSDEEIRMAWFNVGVIVVVGTLLHFSMVLYKDSIPEPFMRGEVKFSIHGVMIFAVMLCQVFALCGVIESMWSRRKIISNVLLISSLIAVSEILFFLLRDLYFDNHIEYSLETIGRIVWMVFGIMGLIANVRIRKLRVMSTKGAWWIMVLFWIGMSQLMIHFNLV